VAFFCKNRVNQRGNSVYPFDADGRSSGNSPETAHHQFLCIQRNWASRWK
jgi:hypothetical protein